MAHIAFCLPALPSHAAVHGVLARALARRGHEVAFVGGQKLSPLAGQNGVAIQALPFDEGNLNGAGLLRTLRLTARATGEWCIHAPAVLGRLAPDLVVVDQAEPGASLAAEAAGLPRITLACALGMERDETIPPPFVDWPYQAGEAGKKRNRGGWKVSDVLLTLQRRALTKGCRAHNLPMRDSMADWISPDLDLRQIVPELDFPHDLPASAAPVGPLREPGEKTLDLEGSDRPLVFASLGTLAGSRRKLLRAICEAASALPVTLLLAHAESLSDAEISELPANVVARQSWPQEAVLQRASACITHAGLNTALDCAKAEVPMVAIPLAFEQPATAARLAYHGVARVVPPGKANAETIRAALADVLDNPAYRDALKAPAAALRKAGGVERAVALVEQHLARQSVGSAA